jgi:hypothetical protein
MCTYFSFITLNQHQENKHVSEDYVNSRMRVTGNEVRDKMTGQALEITNFFI